MNATAINILSFLSILVVGYGLRAMVNNSIKLNYQKQLIEDVVEDYYGELSDGVWDE